MLISTDAPSQTAEIRLLDEHGVHLGYQRVDFKVVPLSRRHGLFDLREFLRHYVEPGQESTALAEIGVCIAQDVLGPEIFRLLWDASPGGTVRVRLPSASDDWLAAALARFPWEIGRTAQDQPTLDDRRLSFRVGREGEGAPPSLVLGPSESLRVLFVFAEARGSRALGARRERKKLQRLFEREIYPKRRIVADTLSYGVTRKRLHQQIQENGGYHIVHWSGHGHVNALELAGPGGAKDSLSGQELLDLFAQAGGIVPALVVLSACQSGESVPIRNWRDFLALAQGEEAKVIREAPQVEPNARPKEPGYSGIAQALIAGGVPSVVAMRYAVGDDYARELAVEFYRALLAHPQPKGAAAALAIARHALREPAHEHRARFAACDHVTALLYGAEHPGLVLPAGRSPGLITRDPRLHRMAELKASEHESFVGRTWELAGLGAEFIGAGRDDDAKSIAQVTGLGGMGKTALAAEALALWEQRFQWVLLYQAKPNALSFDATLNDIHQKLLGELGLYHQHVEANPADAIHRIGTSGFTGPARVDRLTNNLIRALRDEPILLILDNFETNLASHPASLSPEGEPTWACQDPAWDLCLRRMAEELVGTHSRVLVTCRRPLAALACGNVHTVRLGSLSSNEAALYLRDHPGLSRMMFGGDEGERMLAIRLLNLSRFHPLMMSRLASLASGGPTLRPQLLKALQASETTDGHDRLSALFEATRGDRDEIAYLQDALANSNTGLIEISPPAARRLLWMIALANEPINRHMILAVWSDDLKDVEARRARLAATAAIGSTHTGLAKPDPVNLLRHLVALGLVTEETAEPDDGPPLFRCHEVVRECIFAWMNEHPDDLDGLTATYVRTYYGTLLGSLFREMRRTDMRAALEAGRRAIVYFLDARAYDQLRYFADGVIIHTSDPETLNVLMPYLQNAALQAPEEHGRAVCLLILADALDNSGRSPESLTFYDQAADLARTAARQAGGDGRQEWSDLSVILGNWAAALRKVGDLSASRKRQSENAEALRKAAAPAVHIIGSELEMLRLDILDGRSEEVLPDVEARVAEIERWWSQSIAGDVPPDAPHHGLLAQFLLSGLDAARMAHTQRQDWTSALRLTDQKLDVLKSLGSPLGDLASEENNRAVFLTQLGRLGEAKRVLERSLDIFKNNPLSRARALHNIAEILEKTGDTSEAVRQQRRAITIFDALPYFEDRSAAHHNLANYLEIQKLPAEKNRVAALIYGLLSGGAAQFRMAVQGYGQLLASSADAGSLSIRDLMADAAFQPLSEALQGVDVGALQANLDRLREKLRNRGSI
ncbi:CHAT domain-containing protein [Methylobacterium sp. XJLW]|uniref:CHAT domain-containing protein n=1 Tax=Methylobacterium sp. XJLW TaxID=739141 RepID=UPI0013E084D8|nr:CHAT domain-containing protein [Methylobacterium sp. XJLW]